MYFLLTAQVRNILSGKFYNLCVPSKVNFPIGKITLAKRAKAPAGVPPISPAEVCTLARVTRKVRQYELAGVSGVGLRFVVDLEAGKPTAQIGKVLQVLQTLGCSIDILAPGEHRK